MQENNRKELIIYCNCSNFNIIPDKLKQDVQAIIKKSGRNIIMIPDLRGIAAHFKQALEQISSFRK